MADTTQYQVHGALHIEGTLITNARFGLNEKLFVNIAEEEPFLSRPTLMQLNVILRTFASCSVLTIDCHRGHFYDIANGCTFFILR